MAALGGRGVLSMRGTETSHFEVALRSDTMYARTTSSASANLRRATGSARRVRVMFEGTGVWTITSNGVLMPSIEAGLRYDAGDAETGAGLEVGGRPRVHDWPDQARCAACAGWSHTKHSCTTNGALRVPWCFAPANRVGGLDLRIGSAWGATQMHVARTLGSRDRAGPNAFRIDSGRRRDCMPNLATDLPGKARGPSCARLSVSDRTRQVAIPCPPASATLRISQLNSACCCDPKHGQLPTPKRAWNYLDEYSGRGLYT